MKERKEDVRVATKAGRRLSPHAAAGYNRENLTAFVERSLRNLERETLDLLQLHCPPPEVYYQPEVFEILEDIADVEESIAIEAFPFLSWSKTQRSLLRYHRRITSIAGFPQGVCERSLSPPNPFVPTFHQYMPSNHGLL